MLSKYYKRLEKIYILPRGKELRCYCNGTFFEIPLYKYFTYRRLGRNNKYA